MICPRCKATMMTRKGKYGLFFFCVNQHICGQQTVQKAGRINLQSVSEIEECLGMTLPRIREVAANKHDYRSEKCQDIY